MNQSRCEDVSRLFCYLEEPKIRNCVLILEPDAGVSRFMQLKLEEEGFNCLTDNTGDSAVDLAGQRQVDIILLDPDSAPKKRNGTSWQSSRNQFHTDHILVLRQQR